MPSSVHLKVKFLLDRELVTIDASMNKNMSVVMDNQKQVVAPPYFQVAMTFDGTMMDSKVASMINNMNYRPR